MRDAGLTASLSLSIPSVGQFHNEPSLPGLLWLVIRSARWVGTGGLLGGVCHIISAYMAYTCARDHRVRT